jgi:uncharacterized protein (TIGR03067 family)
VLVGRQWLGNYRLDRDTLTVNWTSDKFSGKSAPGGLPVVMVLRRDPKPDGGGAAALIAADDRKEDAVKADKEKLQGTWQLVSSIGNGEKTPEDIAMRKRVIIKDDTITEKEGEKTINEVTFKLDATKKPRAIDATPPGESGKDKTFLGIYSLEGDTLKFCFTLPGQERPSDFTSDPGSGWTLNVLKREKP